MSDNSVIIDKAVTHLNDTATLLEELMSNGDGCMMYNHLAAIYEIVEDLKAISTGDSVMNGELTPAYINKLMDKFAEYTCSRDFTILVHTVNNVLDFGNKGLKLVETICIRALTLDEYTIETFTEDLKSNLDGLGVDICDKTTTIEVIHGNLREIREDIINKG